MIRSAGAHYKISFIRPLMAQEQDESGRILEVLRAAKSLAQEYRQLTGKPLGITREVAEYQAARLLGVELTPARRASVEPATCHRSARHTETA